MTQRNQVLGCLLGGAVGDALGAPVEFMSLAEIRREFGLDGIADYAPVYGRHGSITDDTQMTLFTAEGLIRARVRHDLRGICNPVAVVRHAYLRWLLTQDEEPGKAAGEVGRDGWLIQVEPLWSRRAPGSTCRRALKHADSDLRVRNNSKGCGGVMRVAPVGLIAGSAASAFEFGCETARLTHGHPSGYLSAGYLAALVNSLLEGVHVNDAAKAAISLLRCTRAMERSCQLLRAPWNLPGRGRRRQRKSSPWAVARWLRKLSPSDSTARWRRLPHADGTCC